jgi:hypothetical protein
MARKLVWIETQNFQGFGCSQCSWKFEPTGVVVGESLDRMKRDYEVEREKEFATYVCGEWKTFTEAANEAGIFPRETNLRDRFRANVLASRKSQTPAGQPHRTRLACVRKVHEPIRDSRQY